MTKDNEEKQPTNMNVWNYWGKTDARYAKHFKGRRGGFGGTSVNPTYLQKLATNLWGPIGIGWYYSTEYKDITVGGEAMVVCQLELQYKIDDETWSMPVRGTGGEMLCSKRSRTDYKTGEVTETYFMDDEAYKKATTDALGNAFKMLGASADIWLQEFDDKYHSAVVDELAAAEPEYTAPPIDLPDQPPAEETASKAKKSAVNIDEQIKKRLGAKVEEIKTAIAAVNSSHALAQLWDTEKKTVKWAEANAERNTEIKTLWFGLNAAYSAKRDEIAAREMNDE